MQEFILQGNCKKHKIWDAFRAQLSSIYDEALLWKLLLTFNHFHKECLIVDVW